MSKCVFTIAVMSIALTATTGAADTIYFELIGNAGVGLLPGNENPPVNSTAIGGEVGNGIFYDEDTNELSLEISFEGLTGGLFNAGDGGIHLHDAGPIDPLDNNGGIEINLNSGFANVDEGSTFGTLDVTVILTASQEAELLNSQYYLNIHSAGFGSGELRGNLVPVPEPSTASLAIAGLFGLMLRRKK